MMPMAWKASTSVFLHLACSGQASGVTTLHSMLCQQMLSCMPSSRWRRLAAPERQPQKPSAHLYVLREPHSTEGHC